MPAEKWWKGCFFEGTRKLICKKRIVQRNLKEKVEKVKSNLRLCKIRARFLKCRKLYKEELHILELIGVMIENKEKTGVENLVENVNNSL